MPEYTLEGLIEKLSIIFHKTRLTQEVHLRLTATELDNIIKELKLRLVTSLD